MSKTTVAVIFGGRSVEHDVSIVTGQQIIQALNPIRYEVVPVYISREGKWYTGAPLKDVKNFKDENIVNHSEVRSVVLSPDVRHHGLIVDPLPSGLFKKPEVIKLDVIVPAIHGSHGEDGTLQGLFELCDVPYVGFATMGSALTNDKIITKQVLRQNNIPVVEDFWFSRNDWFNDAEAIVSKITRAFSTPLFVKPATLGSSIGVSRVDDLNLLRPSIDMAVGLDRRVLVEKAVSPCIEINCSVIGYGDDVRASVLEQPKSWGDFLSFEDKYLQGNKGMSSADRQIPAPLSPELTKQIQDYAVQAFKAVDGRGIVRIDFLIQPEQNKVYLNEMNTLPGSFSFYLWKPSGLSEEALMDLQIKFARDAYAEKRRNIYNYKSSLLDVAALRGLKGSKGKA
jgi:D-alanine-D-alanine ligase